MIENRQFCVHAAQRLDAAILAAFPTTTRAFVREAVEKGDVAVAPPGAPAGARRRLPKGAKLRGGETVFVARLAEAADNAVAPNSAIAVSRVYADDALLAFDKPAGQPVQPLSRDETTTLMNGVAARHPECIPLGDRPLMAGALHRIDADTSGLVLVARTAAAFENLRAQFAAQTVEKTYLALVEGAVAAGGALEHDLVHDPTLPFCRMVDADHCRFSGTLRRFHAVTRYEPIGETRVESETRTLLKVTIFTGVTHQIRAQLALGGLHIVNDRLYGAFAVEGQVGHCLHALAAKFRHPTSGAALEVATPAPAWARL